MSVFQEHCPECAKGNIKSFMHPTEGNAQLYQCTTCGFEAYVDDETEPYERFVPLKTQVAQRTTNVPLNIKVRNDMNLHKLGFYIDNDEHLTLYYQDSLTGEHDTTLVFIDNRWHKLTWSDNSTLPTLSAVALVNELVALLNNLDKRTINHG